MLSPFWYIRLTNTRLVDNIFELCDIPSKDSVRQACLHILTSCSSPSITELSQYMDKKSKGRRKDRNSSKAHKSKPKYVHNSNAKKNIDEYLDIAVDSYDLPRPAANKFKNFLSCGCLPFPADICKALDVLQTATKKFRSLENENKIETRRLKRYDDVSRGIHSLTNLVHTLGEMGINPLFQGGEGSSMDVIEESNKRFISQPAYLCLDLGLRQRCKNMHGHLLYQAFVVPDSFFSNNDDHADLKSAHKEDEMKIAEGGRYDDLVRKFRPPGNFGPTQFNIYSAAPIPICVGVRFFIGRIVEHKYLQASSTRMPFLNSETNQTTPKWASQSSGIENIRKSLGHPLPSSYPVCCIIASGNGMDAASLSERIVVAAHLWSQGISAEYVPQSGVMMSLLRKKNVDPNKFESTSSDWTLEHICGICAILKIPFVAIVQPHLLKDKGSVRLRSITSDSFGQYGHEEFVSISSLASTIIEQLDLSKSSEDVRMNNVHNESANVPERSKSTGSTNPNRDSANIEYIYVEPDQYYYYDKLLSLKDTKNKSIRKTFSSIIKKSESQLKHLNMLTNVSRKQVTSVIGIDIPYAVIRDFGTEVMGITALDVGDASQQLSKKFPKYKKILKTLALACDSISRRQSGAEYSSKSKELINSDVGQTNVFMYSISDDKFDALTLNL